MPARRWSGLQRVGKCGWVCASALALRAVLEAPGFVAGLDDLAMVGEPIEQRGGHLGVAEYGGPFAERQVGGDDDRGPFVEPADQVEQELSAGLGEGQISDFVEDDEVEAGQVVGEAALLPCPTDLMLFLPVLDLLHKTKHLSAQSHQAAFLRFHLHHL